jgi:hypothetical protein
LVGNRECNTQRGLIDSLYIALGFAHLRMTNVYFGCVISESSCYDRTRHIPDNRARCDDENFMTYHTKVNTTDEPFKNTD